MGGHLTSLFTTHASFLRAHKLSPKNTRGIIAISGVYAMPAGISPDIFKGLAEDVKSEAPMHQVTNDAPPARVICGYGLLTV